MEELKNTVLKILFLGLFITYLFLVLYLLDFFSDVYENFITTNASNSDKNTAGILGLSFVVFILYGLMLFINLKYIMPQVFESLLFPFVPTSFGIIILSLFILKTNLFIVIPTIAVEILLLYMINNLELYKIKVLNYYSAYYRKKNKKI